VVASKEEEGVEVEDRAGTKAGAMGIGDALTREVVREEVEEEEEEAGVINVAEEVGMAVDAALLAMIFCKRVEVAVAAAAVAVVATVGTIMEAED